jgi:hypothetical protein
MNTDEHGQKQNENREVKKSGIIKIPMNVDDAGKRKMTKTKLEKTIRWHRYA